MIVARLSLAFGVMAAVAASQLPEYAQQYRQRLGGAIGELTRMISTFDADSRAGGLDHDGGVAKLRDNPDRFVQQRGEQMIDVSIRRQRLEAQQQGFAAASPIARALAMVRDLDPAIASGAWSSFEPGIPVTWEGLGAGVLGLLLGSALFRLLAAPFARRTRPGMVAPR